MKPKKTDSFSIKARLKSFQFAGRGIYDWFKAEHNAWIHAVCTVLVLLASVRYHLRKTEWIAVVFAIGFVWVTEMLNTCIEKAMDLMSNLIDDRIRLIKDMAAGAVLIAAIAAAVVGCIVFFPKL